MQHLLSFLAAVGMFVLIGYGGPWLQGENFKDYKRAIDKKGILLEGTIEGKNGHKGHAVIFHYIYKGNEYTNRENNPDYYDNLPIGARVELMVDTLKPEDSYIFATR